MSFAAGAKKSKQQQIAHLPDQFPVVCKVAMDFDSPDCVEKDFPGLYGSDASGKSKKDDKDCAYPIDGALRHARFRPGTEQTRELTEVFLLSAFFLVTFNS